MKRIAVGVLAAVVLLGSIAIAQQTNVLSRNAVGYVRIDCPSNSYTMAAVNFIGLVDNDISTIFGDQLTGFHNISLSDEVVIWNGSSYDRYWKPAPLGGSTWVKYPEIVETTNTIEPGQGFWLINKQATNQSLYLMGEVPDQYTMPTNELPVYEGYNQLSYSFPVEVAITNLNFSSAVQGSNKNAADNIILWDNASKEYVLYWYAPPGWVKDGTVIETEDTIPPGTAFWYVRRTNSTMDWIESKPYTWP